MSSNRARGGNRDVNEDSNTEGLIYLDILEKFTKHKTIRYKEDDIHIKETIQNFLSKSKLEPR